MNVALCNYNRNVLIIFLIMLDGWNKVVCLGYKGCEGFDAKKTALQNTLWGTTIQ